MKVITKVHRLLRAKVKGREQPTMECLLQKVKEWRGGKKNCDQIVRGQLEIKTARKIKVLSRNLLSRESKIEL